MGPKFTFGSSKLVADCSSNAFLRGLLRRLKEKKSVFFGQHNFFSSTLKEEDNECLQGRFFGQSNLLSN